MVTDLTGMEIANASLLDEGTAAAEAMTMMTALRKGTKKNAARFYVDENLFPQTIEVLKTRANPLGIELAIGNVEQLDFEDEDVYGIIIQYPDGNGEVKDWSSLVKTAKAHDVAVCMAADLMALALLRSPGSMGADVVVGTTQRFGVPMGFGGPHAAYFATLEAYKRHLPGRIIGVSVDRDGNTAYRMALQTREQHIRREKATSNICTAQVLLAVMAGMYAVYHGPDGIRSIAEKIHGLARSLEAALKALGHLQTNKHYFDTLKIATSKEESSKIHAIAERKGLNFRYFESGEIGIALDETHDPDAIRDVISVFEEASDQSFDAEKLMLKVEIELPEGLRRSTPYLTHPVFNSNRSEHEMLRYLKHLENKDLSLAHSMISLGSCTMKLNAATEMLPLSWPSFANIHPFVPEEQASAYHQIFEELEGWLNEITGFSGTTLQPNSGAQGEFTGLMIIRAYHENRGESHRTVALIPSSAHGTNPASAVMAGMEVVIVQCDHNGNIDMADLSAKAELHAERLAALMVTYPSTHGVFEENIIEICEKVHQCGGQVYMDGANMNAQVGITSPAVIGADVCHLNLHKTFSIPHGGGGPGMGPVCVAAHLKPFLPGHCLVKTGGEKAITAVSSAPFGSASILIISHAYIAMMGAEGLLNATKLAVLNANYLKEKLSSHYAILYKGKHGRNAHEFILDCRAFKSFGIEVEDIAKRLIDYGFHAPTVSFPVPGTLMIEPTESESVAELDRFCDALINIRREIEEVENGTADSLNNVLKNAPHTVWLAMEPEWQFPYSKEQAFYPQPYLRERKFWPSVRRIDNAYGDRNLFCSCIPVESYKGAEAEVEID